MNELRIISTISPKVESALINYKMTEDIIGLFNKINSIFQNFKHTTLFIIPIELNSIFKSNKRLRLFLDHIEDPQSNIIFINANSIGSDCICNQPELYISNVDDSMMIPKILLKYYNKRKYPLLLDTENNYFEKQVCLHCNASYFCYDKICFESKNIPDEEFITIELNQILNMNIDFWNVRKGIYFSSDLKAIIFLAGIFCEIHKEKLIKIKNYKIHKKLIDDINHSSIAKIFNIALSILRVSEFPNANSINRETNSIDWHRNNPASINGVSLYRIDVMPYNKSGLCSSGVERILLGIKNNIKYFLSYTDTHDFTRDEIQTRIRNIDEDCA